MNCVEWRHLTIRADGRIEQLQQAIGSLRFSLLASLLHASLVRGSVHSRRRTCQRSRVFLLVLFCFFLGGAASFADEKEALTRQLTLKRGGRLTLENTRGDIHITTWKGDRVEIKVQKTGISSEEMELVPVEIEAREDEIQILYF